MLARYLCFACAGAVVPLLAAAPAPAIELGHSTTFSPRDVFSLSHATDVQISPDGKHVAYVRTSSDIMTDSELREIWLIDVATGRQAPLGVAGSVRPRWSPDSRRLAYIARGGDRKPQIVVRDIGTRTDTVAARLVESPNEIAWSPDSRTIAFTMFVAGRETTPETPVAKPDGATWAEPVKIIDQVKYRADGVGYLKPGLNCLFIVAAGGGSIRQLTAGDHDVGHSVTWSADGQRILIAPRLGADAGRATMRDSEIVAVEQDSGALRQLTNRKGPDEQPAASPDGQYIAYVGFDDRNLSDQNRQLYVMRSDGSGARLLAADLDRDVDRPLWSADSRTIFFKYVDHGVTKVGRVGLDGRTAVAATGLASGRLDRPYSSGEYSVAGNGTVAVTAGDATHPSDVAVAPPGGKMRKLTDLNAALFAGKVLAAVRPFQVKSAASGLPIDAWMLTPPKFDRSRKYPLILEIHGGPFMSYGPKWSTVDQLYAAAGYIVVYANPRGSASYGQAFGSLVNKNFPEKDYDDLMSVVDASIAGGNVDPNALYVTGGSGGGMLTAWIVGKTDRFKAAVAQKPVINWTSMMLTTDDYPSYARYWFGNMPWEDPQQYWRRSPLSLAGNVKTPTALMVGEEDFRSLQAEADQFYAALQLRSIPTMLVRVPGAGHDSLADRPSQLIQENATILGWFGKFRPK